MELKISNPDDEFDGWDDEQMPTKLRSLLAEGVLHTPGVFTWGAAQRIMDNFYGSTISKVYTDKVNKFPAIQERPQAQTARLRGRRANILRKIKAVFRAHEVFSADEAAERTGVDVDDMEGYLNFEAQLEGSQIQFGELEGTFVRLTGFEIRS